MNLLTLSRDKVCGIIDVWQSSKIDTWLQHFRILDSLHLVKEIDENFIGSYSAVREMRQVRMIDFKLEFLPFGTG